MICGYLTPWSNEYLRTHTSGVSQHSLHVQGGEAIDIRLPELKTAAVRKWALALGPPGCGLLSKLRFHSRGCRPRAPLVGCRAEQG